MDTREEEQVRLLRALRHVSHLLHHRFSPNASQHRVLRILREEGDKTQKELTDRLEIRAASMSEVLTKLEKAGYIEKRRTEEDRRNYRIRITDRGAENARAHERERALLAERLFRTLDGKEKAELYTLLARLADDWEKEN